MSKQNIHPKIAASLAALAIGAVLASVPAFAQQYGRSPNDGGMVTAPSGGQQLYNSAAPQPASPPHYGRNVDDGGLVDEPKGGQRSLNNSATPQQSTPPHYGRNPDDGGLVQ